MTTKPATFYTAVWAWVRRVPKGRVVTYGQVATALGSPRAARAVGYALFALVEAPRHKCVPWHRVVNAKGEISIGGGLHRPGVQRQMLEAEGICFDPDGRVPLATYRYVSRQRATYVVNKKHL